MERKIRMHLPIIFNLGVIILMVVLDIRDVVYKAFWIGPTDSFSFQCGSAGDFDANHLKPSIWPPNASASMRSTFTPIANTQPESGPIGLAASGWVSFLSRCEKIYPFTSGGGFFLSAMAVNCHVDESTVWDRVVFTSNTRIDSMVWNSCQLLPVAVRPPVCYERIAAGFLERYHFVYPDMLTKWSSPLTPSQQAQLLRLLEMVSQSLRVASRIICVEIVRFEVDQWLTPFAFGCASANVFRSEFVFLEDFWKLQYDKGWLTMDVIQAAKYEFAIRQNCMSRYLITNVTTTPRSASRYHIKSNTQMNFSSFGIFYGLMVSIDIVLLVINVWSSGEILQHFIAPEYEGIKKAINRLKYFSWQQRMRHFSRTVLTAMMVPNRIREHDREAPMALDLPTGSAPSSRSIGSLMRSDSQLVKGMRYSYFTPSLYRNPTIVVLTIITQFLSWFIVLPNSVVWTWSESADQKFRAYQTSIRVRVLLVVFLHSIWDNVVRLNEKFAYHIVKRTYLTSVDLLGIVIVVSIWFRQEIFRICEIKWNFEGQRVNDVNTFTSYVAHGNIFSESSYHASLTPPYVLWVVYRPMLILLGAGIGMCVMLGSFKYLYDYFPSFAIVAPASASVLSERSAIQQEDVVQSMNASEQKEYRRLPIEVLMNSPIRARSLVRNDRDIERVHRGKLEINPCCYAEFGVIIREGFYRSRVGFPDQMRPILHERSLRQLVGVVESSTSKTAEMEEDP